MPASSGTASSFATYCIVRNCGLGKVDKYLLEKRLLLILNLVRTGHGGLLKQDHFQEFEASLVDRGTSCLRKPNNSTSNRETNERSLGWVERCSGD